MCLASLYKNPENRRHSGSVPHIIMSLWEKFHDNAPHTVAAQLRIFTGFPTRPSNLYNFIFIYCYSNYILIFLFIQSFICFYSYLFYIHSFYTIRLMHNIFFTISHKHTNMLKKELPSPFSERQFFFLLFSYYSVLIVKLCSIPLSEAVIILRS